MVSIIVPCYKQAQYLDDTLQSVFNQSYAQWECIIIDDGSPDNTDVVSEKWVAKDKRFRYFRKNNGGLSSARNYGISQSKGEFILPLDADDKIGLKYISLAVSAINTNSQIKVVYCKAEKFGVAGGLWDLPDFSLFNLSRNNCIFCSAVFRKSDWELVGGYDEQMNFGWEDWEFWIALLKNGGEVRKLDEICFYYRTTLNSMLQSMDSEKSTKMLNYLSIKHADFFVAHYDSFISLHRESELLKADFEYKLKSEKFVINAFTKKFFSFTIFKSIT